MSVIWKSVFEKLWVWEVGCTLDIFAFCSRLAGALGCCAYLVRRPDTCSLSLPLPLFSPGNVDLLSRQGNWPVHSQPVSQSDICTTLVETQTKNMSEASHWRTLCSLPSYITRAHTLTDTTHTHTRKHTHKIQRSCRLSLPFYVDIYCMPILGNSSSLSSRLFPTNTSMEDGRQAKF